MFQGCDEPVSVARDEFHTIPLLFWKERLFVLSLLIMILYGPSSGVVMVSLRSFQSRVGLSVQMVE